MAGTNFIKITMLVEEFEKNKCFDASVVSTGQHYDNNMIKLFLITIIL